jgi:hypothetical protein
MPAVVAAPAAALLLLLLLLLSSPGAADAQRWRTDQSYRPFGGGGSGSRQKQGQQQQQPPRQQQTSNTGDNNAYFAGGQLPDASLALRLHNTYRALHVARPLAWDPSLARDAQAWADGCRWRHADAKSGEKKPDQGENLYWSKRYSADESGARAVKAWYREIADVDWRSSMDRRAREPGRIVGHATQVLWRSTARVGCGYSRCASLAGAPAGGGGSDGARADFVVCRYSPAGNYVGMAEREVMPGRMGGPEVTGARGD